ncbi:MAG TPA: hypothetical protein VEK07_15520 [Polyangiaceae bacterium]|nr:hypothetical protein [Polyangiaceae bacterium]
MTRFEGQSAVLVAALAITSARTAAADGPKRADAEIAQSGQEPAPPPASASGSARPDDDTPLALRVSLFAIGGAGIATFAAVGVPAYLQEGNTKAACGPSCSGAGLDSMHARMIVGDVSLGAGLVAAATAAWLTWIGPTHTRPGLGVVPTSHGIGIGYVGVLP